MGAACSIWAQAQVGAFWVARHAPCQNAAKASVPQCTNHIRGAAAGGDAAIRSAVEGAEDDVEQGWKDLESHGIQELDTVVGIAASGRTPYVIGALRHARLRGILTGCVTCNPESAIVQACDHPIVAVTGPEFVTGSTRMKAGTATKLILNRLTTATMIQLGHVQGNRMVDMQLTNAKLVQRGARMVSEATGLALEDAELMLKQHGSVRAAVEAHEQQGHART